MSSAWQPDDVSGADDAGEFGLHRGLVEGRVATGVELDGFGHQDGALSINLDATTLVDQ